MADPVHNNWYQSGTVLGGQNTAGFRAPVSRKITSVWGLPLSPLTFEQELKRRMDRIFAPILKELELLKEEIKKEEVEITRESAGEIDTTTTESGGHGGGLEKERVQFNELEMEEGKLNSDSKKGEFGKQNSNLKSFANLPKNIEGSRSSGGGDFAGGGGAGGFAGEADCSSFMGEKGLARNKGRETKVVCCASGGGPGSNSEDIMGDFQRRGGGRVIEKVWGWNRSGGKGNVAGSFIGGRSGEIAGIHGGGDWGKGSVRTVIGDGDNKERGDWKKDLEGPAYNKKVKKLAEEAIKGTSVNGTNNDIKAEAIQGPHWAVEKQTVNEFPPWESTAHPPNEERAFPAVIWPVIHKPILTPRNEAHTLSFLLELITHLSKPSSKSQIHISKTFHPSFYSLKEAENLRPTSSHLKTIFNIILKLLMLQFSNSHTLSKTDFHHSNLLNSHKFTTINCIQKQVTTVTIATHLEDKVDLWAAGSGEYGGCRFVSSAIPQLERAATMEELGNPRIQTQNSNVLLVTLAAFLLMISSSLGIFDDTTFVKGLKQINAVVISWLFQRRNYKSERVVAIPVVRRLCSSLSSILVSKNNKQLVGCLPKPCVLKPRMLILLSSHLVAILEHKRRQTLVQVQQPCLVVPCNLLLGALSTASYNVLPGNTKEIISDPSMPSLELYPATFDTDWSVQHVLWHKDARLPYIDNMKTITEPNKHLKASRPYLKAQLQAWLMLNLSGMGTRNRFLEYGPGLEVLISTHTTAQYTNQVSKMYGDILVSSYYPP